jgi:hypothetical protein
MAYERYRDRNGVTWTIVWTHKGHTAIATVLDDADPKYDPDLGDLKAEMDPGGVQALGYDIIEGDPATDEQQRVLFIELTGKIEKLAAEHSRATSLKVTPAPEDRRSMSPFLFVGLVIAGVLLLED